jgi:hypothetical protein
MTTKTEVPCSLIINVARGDTPILEYTLPHIIDSHKVWFAEVIVVIDEKPSEGRIRQNYQQYSLEALYEALAKVRGRGYKFRQEAISYRSEDVQRVFSKWFGNPRVTFRCAGGTPIYAFLYGLDVASYDFRLHLDSDMLIHDPGPASWAQKAIEVLRMVPEILFVNQRWGIQTAANPAPKELPSFDLGYGQRVSQIFSSRCFLFSRQKLNESFLPIMPKKHPIAKRLIYKIQNRSPYIALEQMISSALSHKGLYRADLDLDWGCNLHAWDKGIFQDRYVNDVLQRIEIGQFPFSHTGQYNLDYNLFLQELGQESIVVQRANP